MLEQPWKRARVFVDAQQRLCLELTGFDNCDRRQDGLEIVTINRPADSEMVSILVHDGQGESAVYQVQDPVMLENTELHLVELRNEGDGKISECWLQILPPLTDGRTVSLYVHRCYTVLPPRWIGLYSLPATAPTFPQKEPAKSAAPTEQAVHA